MPHFPHTFSSSVWRTPSLLACFYRRGSPALEFFVFFFSFCFFCSLPGFGSKGLWGLEQGGEHTEISAGAPFSISPCWHSVWQIFWWSPCVCPGKAQLQPVTSLQPRELPHLLPFHNSKIRDGQRVAQNLFIFWVSTLCSRKSCSLWMLFPKCLPKSKQACTEFQWAELNRLKSLFLSGEYQLYGLRRTKERRDNTLLSPPLWKMLYCRTFVDLFFHISDRTTSVLASQFPLTVVPL